MTGPGAGGPIEVFEIDGEGGLVLPCPSDEPPAARRWAFSWARSVAPWQWVGAGGLISAATADILSTFVPLLAFRVTLPTQPDDQSSPGFSSTLTATARLNAWGQFRAHFISNSSSLVIDSGEDLGFFAVLLFVSVALSLAAVALLLQARTSLRRLGALAAVMASGFGVAALGDIWLGIQNLLQQLPPDGSAQIGGADRCGLYLAALGLLLTAGVAVLALLRTSNSAPK